MVASCLQFRCGLSRKHFWEDKDKRRRNINDEDPYLECKDDPPIVPARVQEPVTVASMFEEATRLQPDFAYHDNGVNYHYSFLGAESEAEFCVSFCMEFLDTLSFVATVFREWQRTPASSGQCT